MIGGALLSKVRAVLERTQNEIGALRNRVCAALRVLLVQRKRGCLLVSSDSDHITKEGEGGAFAVVTMYQAARIQAT